MADERQATRARMRVAGPENPSVRAGTEDERGVRRPGDGGGTRRERDRDIASRGLTSQNRRAMAMGEIRTRVTPGEQLRPGNGGLRTRPRRREVRRTTVDGIVDTLVIPEEVANELGLRREARGRSCTPTNGATNGRSGRGVTIEIGSLTTESECMIGPAGSEVLIGQVVLEALDLIADSTNRTVTPRHPEGPVLALRRAG